MKPTQSKCSYFIYFLLFNLYFFILQASLLYVQNKSFVRSIFLPEIAWQQILITIGIHIVLYLLLSLFQTILLLGILKRPWHHFSPDQWQIIIWFLCASVILCANAYYFPLSIFSKLLSPPIPILLIVIVLLISGSALCFLIVNSLCYRQSMYTLLITFPILCFFALNLNNRIIKPLPSTKPNVIILGIDSLSPESINSQNMPFFSQLIKNSTQFNNAISPLARTYPAWTSILTGLYTKHHYAEENLVARSMVKSQESIAWLLKKNGYDTIFATDDRRFNNIDKDYGFKKIIGPKTGVNDMLLGTFNDFPLGNLLINFRISAWLFPFNYSNRASFFSYYPETFSRKLENELSKEVHHFPVFLATHFTLPHWPYAWAKSLPEQVHNEFSIEKREELYQQSLQRIDKQFQSFFNYLQQRNYFENSLLLILSDHGEVLYYPNSRLTNYHNYVGKHPSKFAQYLKQHTATVLNKSAGHGSDILSPKQYHSVLAFRLYENGKIITPTSKVNTRVALIDLAPTILDFLHLNTLQKMDGISLLSSLLNPRFALPKRFFFIESGMFPNQLLSKQKSIEIGKRFYNVNPISGELEIKSNKINTVRKQKLYGIINGDWVLALYPNKKTYIAVIQNLATGLWIDNLHSDFAKSTPAIHMYQQMQQFYDKELFLPLP
ncbi:sulfatase-like hydrolase/transferase [Legionella sp.]|uniref:sulfatase-like hydrolase/transferase n=1 Tax=Legionella sp. TaxID=459 RepID=UPI003C8A3CCC